LSRYHEFRFFTIAGRTC